MAHDSIAELNKDASNRLVASTIYKLSTAADGTLNKAIPDDPATAGDWLAAGMVDNIGKKIAGEFFTVGAFTNGKLTGGNVKAAKMDLIATANCKTTNSSGSATLNFLTPYAKVDKETSDKTADVYSGRAYMVPTGTNGATPGQKYYSCIKVG